MAPTVLHFLSGTKHRHRAQLHRPTAQIKAGDGVLLEGNLQVEDVVDDVLDDLQLWQTALLWNAWHQLLQLGQQRLHLLLFRSSLAEA